MAKKTTKAEVERIISVIKKGEKQDVIILLVPSHDNKNNPIRDQEFWANAALELFGSLYGGATSFQALAGIYVDDKGTYLRDRPILIESYTSREFLENTDRLIQLVDFMKRMGRETKQASVAVVISDVFHQVRDF